MIREYLFLIALVVLMGSMAFNLIAEGIFTLDENTRAQIIFDFEYGGIDAYEIDMDRRSN